MRVPLLSRLIMMLVIVFSLTSCMEEKDLFLVERVDTFGVPEGCFRMREAFLYPPQVCYRESDLITSYGAVPAVFDYCDDGRCCEDDVFRLPDMDLIRKMADGTFNIADALTDPLTGDVISSPDGGNSGMVKMLFIMTDEFVRPAVETLYQALAGPGAPWRIIIYNMCVLAIIFFSASIALGIRHGNVYDLFLMAIKISFVIVFGTNFAVFEDHVIEFINQGVVTDLAATIIASVSSENADTYRNLGSFEEIDAMLSMFFSAKYFMLVFALILFSPGIGILFIILTFTYLALVVKAMTLYLMAYFARALLFAMAPIFISFLVLNQTSSLFRGWYTQLINYSLQPLFVMSLLTMFHLILIAYINSAGLVADQTALICWLPWFTLFAGSLEVPPWWWRIADSSGAQISGSEADMPINLWVLISLVLLCWLMRTMFDWCIDVAARLSGGIDSASRVPLRGWEPVKQQALKAPAAVLGGARGLIFGSRAAGGSFTAREGGLWGTYQGRGSIVGGAQTGARAALKKQQVEVNKALYNEHSGVASLFGYNKDGSIGGATSNNSVLRKGLD